MGLLVEAAQGIRKIAVPAGLGGTTEMALLAELGALIGQLPADPLGDIIFAARVLRPEPSGLLGQIHHDRPRLEDRERGAAAHRLIVDDRRHPAIRRNLQEIGGELVTAADIDRLDRVRKREFLEQDDALLAVTGRPEIQVDHSGYLLFYGGSALILAGTELDCPPPHQSAPRSGS